MSQEVVMGCGHKKRMSYCTSDTTYCFECEKDVAFNRIVVMSCGHVRINPYFPYRIGNTIYCTECGKDVEVESVVPDYKPNGPPF